MIKVVKKCQICKKRLVNFLNLGKQPLCDDLHNKSGKNKFYKLQIKFCNNCYTAFQKYNINKKTLFPKTYHYRSSNTNDVIDGMKDLVSTISLIKKDLKDLKVIDIGCNDGSLLSIFKKRGAYTIGIEPTGAAKEAKKKGHIIYNKFFEPSLSTKIKKKFGNIDIITFTNVFAHIENFDELIRSLKKLISNRTLIVIENHYLGEVIKKNQFDTFYHEHPRTYSLNSFYHISKLLDVKILNFEFVKRYNGNLRVFLTREFKQTNDLKLLRCLKKEKKILPKIKIFQKKINKWKKFKKNYIKSLNKKFGPIPAKAFPGRASILLNLLKLNNNNISKIYEKNSSLKVNKYAPGTDIKIEKEKNFKTVMKSNKIIINLAWHISSEIKNYLRKHMKYKGSVIDILSSKDFK